MKVVHKAYAIALACLTVPSLMVIVATVLPFIPISTVCGFYEHGYRPILATIFGLSVSAVLFGLASGVLYLGMKLEDKTKLDPFDHLLHAIVVYALIAVTIAEINY
jgi:hypothetical protein